MKLITKLFAVFFLLTSVNCFSQTIKYGPWVTAVTDSSAIILWESENPGLGFVDVAGKGRVYDTFCGRRFFDSFHSVKLTGFEPGTAFEYRIGGQVLLDDSNAYDPKFDEEYVCDWHKTSTFNINDKYCHFVVMNDIHNGIKEYEALVSQIDRSKTDFVFLNGDIASANNYSRRELIDQEIAPLGDLVSSKPVFFARGNHEGRGTGIRFVKDIYPNNSSDAFYHAFRNGPVAFIVFDAGETSVSRSKRYSGGPMFEDYIFEQIAWFSKIIKEPWFASAQFKICMLHVPMVYWDVDTDEAGHNWMNKNFLPLLNEAGFDFMLAADFHEQLIFEPGQMNNSFPIIVNSTRELLDFNYQDGKVSIKITDPEGKVTYERK